MMLSLSNHIDNRSDAHRLSGSKLPSATTSYDVIGENVWNTQSVGLKLKVGWFVPEI